MIRAAFRRTVLVGIGIAILIGGPILAWTLLPVRDWIELFIQWVRGFGIWGVITFALLYVAAVVMLAPAGLMSVAAGIVFGAWGIPIVIFAASAGAVLAFSIARHLVRRRIQALIEKRRVLLAIDRAIAEESWRVIVLLRLTPIVPFNLQNYFLGATDVRFWPYLAGTFFGIMPGTALYVYLGSIGRIALTGGENDTINIVMLAVGVLTGIVVVFLIARKARAKLREMGVASRAKS